MIKNENLMDAIGMVDEEVVLDAKAYKRTKIHFPRAALIAACFGVMLIGTAFAAEMIWGVFTKGTRDHPNYDHLELFEFATEGTTCFELDEILADIEVLAEERESGPNRPTSGRLNVAAFENWEMAAEYIGVPLATNNILQQYPQTESLVGPTTDNDGNPLFLYVSNSYLVDNMTVSVGAYLRTNHAGDESLYTRGISYNFSTMTVEDSAYQMSDGSSAVIFKSFGDSYASYNGVFVQEGILYWVSLFSKDGENNSMEDLLLSIMAAY